MSNYKNEIYNWLDTNNFCAMPFFHIAIESNGDIRPCCLGDPLKNTDGTTLNITGKSIIDIINHPTHIEFRNTFNRNEQHPACSACWGKFQNDRFSGRYVYSGSSRISTEVYNLMKNNSNPEQKLLWLEIKAGNRCNLSCRICGLWNSSRWLMDSYNFKKQITKNYPELKLSSEYAYNKQAEWIDDVNFWKNIDGFDDIKVIHLMGGEPLMIPEHFEMLESIANKFNPFSISIWYNTNGTIIPSKKYDNLLSKFQNIFWSLSIDDFGEKFNYQRKGAYWDDVKQNLSYFKTKDNFSMNIDCTINIHNIFTINEFVKELGNLGLEDYFHPHYVTSPDGIYNVRGLRSDIKDKVKNQLLKNRNSLNHNFKLRTDEIIDFMMSVDTWSEDLDLQRREAIMIIDKLRGESFIKTFPEMAELLGYV